MNDELIKITPDKQRAKSILKMAKITFEMIESIDINKFSSNVVKEYYEIIRELLTIVLLLDGYRAYGEGSHKKLIDYLHNNYGDFTDYELTLINLFSRNRLDIKNSIQNTRQVLLKYINTCIYYLL